MAAAVGLAGMSPQLHAASESWVAAPADSTWVNALNWTNGIVPGAVNPAAAALSNDVATFNTPIPTPDIGDAANPILIDVNRNIKSILFDTASVGAYQIGVNGGNTLYLTDTGTGLGMIGMTSTVASPEVIAAPLNFRLASSTNGSIYTMINNASSGANTLTFTGGLTFAGGTRPMALTLDGTNAGNNSLGSFTDTTGAINFVKQGTGTWVLPVANSFLQVTSAGDVASCNINAGLLICQNAGSLGAYTTVAVGTTGILRLDGVNLNNTNVSLNQTGEILANGNAQVNAVPVQTTATSVTLATTNATDVFTVGTAAGKVSGGAATSVVNVAGPGEVLLNYTSTYIGSYSLNSGTTVIGTATSLGSATTANVAFGAGSTGTLNLNGQNVTLIGLNTNGTSSGTPVVQNGAGSNSILTVNTAAASSFAGNLRDGTGGGLLNLNKSGASSLTLGGAGTYSGFTNVSAGTLFVTNTTGSATGTGPVNVLANGTLGGTGNIAGLVTVNSAATIAPGTTGVGLITVGSLTLNTGSKLSYDISSTSSLDQINVTNSGGLTINGATLTINGGTVPYTTNGVYTLLTYSGTLGGSGTIAVNANNENTTTNTYAVSTAGGAVTLTIANTGGTIDYYNVDANGNWSNPAVWTAGVPNAQGAFASFGGGGTAITAPRTVTVDGSYTVGTIAFNNPSFGYTLAAGTGANLTLDNGTNGAFISDTAGTHSIASPITLTTNGATFAVANPGDTLTLSGAISGTGAGLTKAGTGTVALTGSNTYFGGTMLNSGTLQINSATSLGDPSGNLTFNGGALQLMADVSTARTYVVGGVSDATINVNSHTFNLSAGTISASSSGTGGLVINGPGTAILPTVDSYTGRTLVNNATLNISNNTSLGAASAAAALVLNSATLTNTATLDLDDGTSTVVVGTTSTLTNTGVNDRPVTFNSGTNTITVATGTSLSISGAITGAGSLVANGPGQLNIFTPTGGQNTFTGGTLIGTGATIELGDVNADGSGLGTGTIVLDGGTLNLHFTTNTTPTSFTLTNALQVDAGFAGTLITDPRGDVSGALTGAGTLNIVTDYVRSQFDNNFSGFTGQINIAENPDLEGGDFRLNSTTGFGIAAVNIGPGVNLYDLFNFGAGGQTESIGELTGTGTLSGGPTAGRTMTWSIGGRNTNFSFGGFITDRTGPTAIIKVGTGAMTLTGNDTYSGSTNVSAGSLVLASTTALPVATSTFFGTALIISPANGSTATLVASKLSSEYLVSVSSLTFGGTLGSNTGKLDLVNNALDVHAGSLANITAQVKQGFNSSGPVWQGSGGITSSAAASNSNNLTALGVILNDNGSGQPLYGNNGTLSGTFAGSVNPVDNDVLVKYTYYGDADLSGVVDGSDYAQIDNAFIYNQTTSNSPLTGWYNGDFNYDGVIDGSDYALIDNAFNRQGASLAIQIATPSSLVGGGSAVPEPTAFALLGITAVGLLGRRKRQC